MDRSETVYQVKNGYVHRKVADNDILISIGNNIANFNGYIVLNATASFLWDTLSEPRTASELVRLLTEEFEVSEETAAEDVEAFLQMLQENSMVTVNAYETP